MTHETHVSGKVPSSEGVISAKTEVKVPAFSPRILERRGPSPVIDRIMNFQPRSESRQGLASSVALGGVALIMFWVQVTQAAHFW